jgi:hypothetical protein
MLSVKREMLAVSERQISQLGFGKKHTTYEWPGGVTLPKNELGARARTDNA